MSGVKGKSGRKPRPKSLPFGSADYKPRDLTTSVAALSCVVKKRLSPEKIETIAARLSELIGHYECAKDWQRQLPGKDDRAKQILVADCGRLWHSITGVGATNYVNSPHVQLAKLVLTYAGDGTGNLRRMAARAMKVEYPLTDEETREVIRMASHKTSMAGQLGI
jgi:hypothetical protein